MKFFYKLLIPTILFPFFSFAQGNYKPGFVVNSKGDTIKGFIDLKEWGNNPQNITFKKSLDEPPQTFTVNDIHVFELPGYVAYKSFVTSISLDEIDIQKLEDHRDTSTKTDNVFLKMEQRGRNVTLYSYTDALKERFYLYDSQTKKIAELIYRIYFVPNEKNNVTTVSQNGYKQQLLLSAQKYNAYDDNLKPLLENSNYQRSELLEICSKINGKKQGEEAYNTHHGKYVRFFAGVGVNFNTVNFTGATPLYNMAPSYNSVAPRVSAGFNFYPVPDVGKWLLKFEVAYSSDTYKTIGSLYYYDPTIKSTFNAVQHTISVIPQVQYNIYNTDAFKFYLDAGFSVNFSQYGDNSVYDPLTKYPDNDFIGFDNRWFSFPFKAGIVLNKRIDISVMYTLPAPISDDATGHHEDFNYSFKLSSLGAGVSYIF